MNMKKTRLAALVLTGALLTGCGIGSSVDTLLLPPMLSDEQKAIYTARQEAISHLYIPEGEHTVPLLCSMTLTWTVPMKRWCSMTIPMIRKTASG